GVGRPGAGGGVEGPARVLADVDHGAADGHGQPDQLGVAEVAGVPPVAGVDVGGAGGALDGDDVRRLAVVRVGARCCEVAHRRPCPAQRGGGGVDVVVGAPAG